MMCEATLSTVSKDPRAVAASISADNTPVEGLSVSTSVSDSKVSTKVSAQSLSSLLSTLDDVLRCQMASEAVING